MSFLTKIFGVGGSKTSTKAVDKDQLKWLLELGLDANRFNQNSLFSGWEWSKGPDGRMTQQQTVNPELQPALDALLSRVNQGSEDPQLKMLKDARFAALMAGPQGPSAMPAMRDRSAYMPQRPPMPDREDYGPPPDWYRK